VAEELGTLSFASWIRQGLAAGISRVDDGSGSADGNTIVPIVVNVDDDLQASVQLQLVGPGDIVGLDSNVVVRVWPTPDDNDAEFESLALIEFDQADLPWRYTPAVANASGQLRPWLALLVFEEGEASITPPTPSLKQTVVTVQNGAALPDLAQAWAWAHTQFIGKNLSEAQLSSSIKGAPGKFASRILCSRLLESNKSYTACLVPTFARGAALASNGTPPDDTVDALAPAWQPGQSGVKLPVYYSWRFQTGSVGSFRQLAKRIEPERLPADVGRRAMDVASPGLGLPAAVAASPQVLEVEGALQSVEAFNAGPSPWASSDKSTWIAALQSLLNTPQVVVDGAPIKVVAPPLYGRWYAAQQALAVASNQPWFFTLNSDPRTRVGGGLGSIAIQNNQQALLASAWNQAGEIGACNARLKVAQLGREVLSRLFARHVATGTADTFWTLTGRLHAFAKCSGQTLCVRLDSSPVGHWLFDPSWRRVSRSFGAFGRFQGKPALPAGATSNIVSRLNAGQLLAPEAATPFGLFTTNKVFEHICFDGLTSSDLDALTKLGSQLLLFWGLVILYTARQLLVTRNGECFGHALRMMRFGISLIQIANSIAGNSPGDAVRRLHWCAGTFSCADLRAAPTAPNFAPLRFVPSSIPLPPQVDGAGSVDTAAAVAFRNAFCAVLDGPQPTPPTLSLPPKIPDIEECRLELRVGLEPALTVERRFKALVTLDPSVVWQPKDPLEPIFLPPTYQAPMYVPLASISKEWIMPGIGALPRDSIGLAMTNQRFVEAYMVGCNQELNRELLFNEFPVDQRATFFRQFWDVAGVVPAAGSTIDPEKLRDILPIAGWAPNNALGSNSARVQSPNGGERTVLVVRAELIQRYPNVIVYAVPAVATPTGHVLSDQEVHPVFYGTLNPDIAFYGFDLALSAVRGTPGYFFVLQEHPTAPKFVVPLSPGSMATPPVTASGQVANTSGEVANTTFHDPFRIAIHGSVLLPATS
jgi:hypothetical protein